MNENYFHTSQRYRVEYSKFLLYYATFILFLITVTASAEPTYISLDCITDYNNLTSPDYPSLYPNDASVEWYITAPSHMRILVTFHDFNLEARDDVEIMDMVNPRTINIYTGENKHFPPYLTKAYSLKIKFISSSNGRRKGFNISLSCYKTSKNVPVRLVDGTSPGEGFLELPSKSGEWMRVCEDSLSNTVAEVICGELGYPGVRNVTNVEGECISDHVNETCKRAPTCQDNTYRLVNCEPVDSPCSFHHKVVKVNCYEPGYSGCSIKSETMNLHSSLPFISTARCISSCKSDDIQAVAIMNQEECFCTTYAKLEDAAKCSEETEGLSRMSVYSASVGFCEDLNDTTGGSWDSNITWFGSIVHLTCLDGYSLNGSGTLRCVPGVTPYYPEWNGSFSSCIMDGSTTAPPKSGRWKTVIIVVAVIAIIILIAMVFAGCYKWTRKYHWKSRSENRTGQSNGQSRSANNRRGADTSARHPNGTTRSNTTRHGNGSSTRNTINSTPPISVIPPVVPNNVPQDIQPPALPSSHPSNTSDIPLTLLLQSNPRTDNHYVSSNSYPNPYNYASSTDTQRLASTSLEEAYQEPSSMGMVNHSYEDAGDERGQSNATLQTEHTLATELSMISRPLPHRPFSSNCNEGPTLPPRDTSLHSKKRTLVAVSLRQRKSKTVNENNNLPLGACASEYNVVQDLPNMQLHGTSCKQPGQPSESQFYHTLEDEEHGNLRQDRHNHEAPTSGAPRGNTPDQFYHLLENDASGSDSGNNNHLLYHTPPHTPDRTDRTDSTMMIDNILYTPLKSSSKKLRIPES